MNINLNSGWKILQDVHGVGEILGMFKPDFEGDMGNQISEWEPLPRLAQLQTLYSDQPYFGRENRYFNDAPWWYQVKFDLPEDAGTYVKIRFTNVDYLCKAWLNGVFLGEHEGYTMPFSFRADAAAVRGGTNTLTVKVSSPWDTSVDGGREDRRTYMVNRNLVKGTYEHSDTFVQRDMNPVGIYGQVSVETCARARFEEKPDITYVLNEKMDAAQVRVKVPVVNLDGGAYQVRFTCRDRITRETVARADAPVTGEEAAVEALAEHIRLWNTWDKGGAWLYEMTVELIRGDRVLDIYRENMGFRKIDMIRTKDVTRFMLNNRPLYVRGSSYFPDLYVSNMYEERYRRDLTAVKAAGFNLLRIHVHIEFPRFYELCDEMGIAVMQDSEFNWMHPATDEFADRFVRVYLEAARSLKRHTSLICWILMNEPGLEDPMGKSSGRAMTVNPGPRLLKAVREMDPSRPVIKGSFCEDDMDSGDSHNYIGSLCGAEGHYADIYGTVEKLNTEYGFDAPPCEESLRNCPKALARLSGIANRIDEIQHYQYALLKYYTEHYRMQKYAPNSGYVQFLFSDMSPQSFYGIYDFWGMPKAGAQAIWESNMPMGVFLKYSRDGLGGVYAVNDMDDAAGRVTVTCVFTDEKDQVLLKETRDAELGADCLVNALSLDEHIAAGHGKVNCALTMTQGGKVIATNHYEDLFNMPEHVKGHPQRISHELGMRLYFA